MSPEERSPSGRISAALRRDAANQAAEPVVLTTVNPNTRRVTEAKLRGIWVAAAIAAVVLVALAIRLSTARTSSPPAEGKVSGPYLNLDLRTEGDQLKLISNSNLASVQSAHLDIFDGNSIKQMDVTDQFKAQQPITVPHSTGNVQAVLTVGSSTGSLVRKAGFTDSAAVLKSESEAATTNSTNTEAAAPNPKPTSARHKRHRRGH